MLETTFFHYILFGFFALHIPAIFFIALVASALLGSAWKEEHAHKSVYLRFVWFYVTVLIPIFLLGLGALNAYRWIENSIFKL
jgi:hypothetical protein